MIVERDLMEKFHWTPQEIAKIPYKWIQKFYLFENTRINATETKKELQTPASNIPKKISNNNLIKNSNEVKGGKKTRNADDLLIKNKKEKK